jgi:translation initiation factor 1
VIRQKHGIIGRAHVAFLFNLRCHLSNSRLVYSSDVGRVCPSCGRPRAECVCKKQSARPGGDGIVRVRRETQDRHGKTVTAITGLPLDDDQLREFAGDLKRQCGTGGSVKDGVIIMQGDCCDRVMALIHKQGYTVKRAGG